MQSFKEYVYLKETPNGFDGNTPPKSPTLNMSDKDWKHQHTAGNVETILEEAVEEVHDILHGSLQEIATNEVYPILYHNFKNGVSPEEVKKFAIATLWDKFKLKLNQMKSSY